MSLITLFVDTNHSVSYDVDPDFQPEDYEAGHVGILINKNGKVVVRPALSTDTNITMLGIIDESKNQGSLFGNALNDLQNIGVSVAIGPHSVLASGKVTLHMSPGIYITDQFADSLDINNPPNTGAPLYVEDQSRGLITDTGAVPIGVFVDFVSGVSLVDTETIIDSTKKMLVLKFDPLSAAVLQEQAQDIASSAVTSANSFVAISDQIVIKGNAVYVKSATGRFGLATNDQGIEQAKVVGFSLGQANIDQIASIFTGGLLELSDWSNIANSSQLIPGTAYYLDVDGKITSNAPSTPSASFLTRIGTSLTTNILKINIEPVLVL